MILSADDSTIEGQGRLFSSANLAHTCTRNLRTSWATALDIDFDDAHVRLVRTRFGMKSRVVCSDHKAPVARRNRSVIDKRG